MTTNAHPFQASAAAANGSQPQSQARLLLDNLLRRELKVTDPNDPSAVATALFERYKSTPRALAIQSEARGLPPQVLEGSPMLVAATATSSDSELDQAVADVNRDLEELSSNTILKDITPELQGWANAIRSLIQEGINSARFALDVTKRDQAFAMRRSLGDYARMARLLGVLTPAMTVNYRKLAQSLDEAASVLLVRMGEALANVGFNGGRFLLQAPYAELQSRRDSVIQNLRGLLTSYQMDWSVNEWNRGLDSYRRLSDVLEKQGQGDLRALLNENELSRTMDSLIQRAAHGSMEGLRALGSTAKLDLQRFRRLVAVGTLINDPLSPPLTSFLQSLQLFVDAFGDTGGFRLLWIARPPLLFYGLYGSGVTENSAAQRLINIASRRAALADALDCLASRDRDPGVQVLLDKILYDIDRAIDLYAMGSQEFGDAEKRAAAYGCIIATVLEIGHSKQHGTKHNIVATLLDQFKKELLPEITPSGLSQSSEMEGISNATIAGLLIVAEKVVEIQDWNGDEGLKQRIPILVSAIKTQESEKKRVGYSDIVSLIADIYKAKSRHKKVDDLIKTDRTLTAAWQEAYTSLAPLHSELCLQITYDTQWDNLAGSMAPGCIGYSAVSGHLNDILEKTRENTGCMECSELRIPMPASNEQNFNTTTF